MPDLDKALFARLNAEQNVGNRVPIIFGDGGMPARALDDIEGALGFPLPPDLRFLLQNVRDPGGVLFPWWNFNLAAHRQSIEWVVQGILFDVENDWLWLARWGERPDDAAGREQRVRDDFTRWPKLVPVHGHRYLPAEPCEAGNPVFSIRQTDIIYYGDDLASYLLNEFASGPADRGWGEGAVRRIPIWSDFVENSPGFIVEKPPEHYEKLQAQLAEFQRRFRRADD